MYSRPKGVLLACILFLMGLAPMSALATIEWTFSPSCNAPPCATDSGGFKTFLGTDASSSEAGPSVAASGWSNTVAGAGSSGSNPGSGTSPYPGSDTNLAIGEITQSKAKVGGLGVANASETGLQASSMDNNQNIDLILFQFCVPPVDGVAPDGEACVPEEVALSEISLWQSSQEVWNADLDISVLAYTGEGTPDLTGREYFATSEDLTANGWEIIGNYDAGSTQQAIVAINSERVSSSHWIVSPFNPALCETGNCQPDSLEYLQVTGLKADGPAPNLVAQAVVAQAVPAPSTLLLLAGGLPLIRRMRSIRAKRVHC